jgi:(1->4)-alpha-D-glucan 1-alpha-D-glucosylmutase
MRIPLATYRIQFNPSFDFNKVKSCVSYLVDLGVSAIYASPIFKAKKGSLHGYDVVNPNEINPELGGREMFDQLSFELKRSGLGWIQDIVPNHMAFDYDNSMLMDVFERGKNSEFYHFFDIDWDHPFDETKGKLLAPFLGEFFWKCLEDQEIQLSLQGGEIRASYYDMKFVLLESSYSRILGLRLGELKKNLGEDHPAWKKFCYLLSFLEKGRTHRGERPLEDEPVFKKLLREVCEESQVVKKYIQENIRIFNGTKGSPDSFNLLGKLLSEQLFRLSFWKVATEEINYRRFFNVNELICLRTEDRRVFDHTHFLIFSLLDEGKFTGLRIDHVDGLYDPTEYLRRLRKRAGDVFLVVEKILQPDEELLSRWPIQGTTGYEWLNQMNSLFCDSRNMKKFDRIYSRFSGFSTPYQQLVSDKKRLIIGQHMAGDIDNLAKALKRISVHSRQGEDTTLYGLRRAIVEIMAQFPVYRTYITKTMLRDEDASFIQGAADKARKKIPGFLPEIDFVEHLLLGEPEFFPVEKRRQQRDFVMRFQQFTGPLMAKGFEDTVLYIYNRLLSLNEVGGSPDRFGNSLEAFHRFSKKRAELWPHSMNATSSHDTKRGEDVRARLNVLSEIPDEWEQKLRLWRRLNRRKKRQVNGIRIPDRNDEYFLYQTLTGAFPFYEKDYSSFVKRMRGYIVKSVREAKVHTAWLKPDLAYEEAYVSFMEDILDPEGDNAFLREFLPFQKKIAHYGMFNSLSQTLLKCTSPGIPDIYQGAELWDLSLVDPDNRRPVDFERRKKFLEGIKSRAMKNVEELLKDLMLSKEDGRIKLFLIHKALSARREVSDVFEKGAYIPLHAEGKRRRHVVAFARNAGDSWALIIAPRFLTSLVDSQNLPLGPRIWEDTCLLLPEKIPLLWVDIFSARIIRGGQSIMLSEVLKHFPVACLLNRGKK